MAKIMIVDDASFMRNTLKYIVESMGHEVVASAAGYIRKSFKADDVTAEVSRVLGGGGG